MSTLKAADVYRLAIAAGFSPADAVIVTQVAWAESGFNPNATHKNPNGSTDYGLMQINSVHSDILATGNWADPATNLRMAKAVKDQQGWTAWKGYTSGRYKQVKVRGNPFSAGSQDVSFTVPKQGQSFAVTGSTADPTTTGVNVGNPLAPITDAIGALTNPGLWTRIGIGGLGMVLVILGILFLFWVGKDKVVSGTVGTVIKGVTK